MIDSLKADDYILTDVSWLILSRWMIQMRNSTLFINHSSNTYWSLLEIWPVFLIFVWQLIIYSIDIRWIMSKETINGSLDYTCTTIRGNPSKRVFHPTFWFRYSSDFIK